LIRALLNNKHLRNREWSGPAWFTYKTNKNGFPCHWNLEFFWVLNVGSKSETDWDEEDLVKDLQKIWEIAPETATNKWYRGNIHSHNTMKAFFSQTDVELLEEMGKTNDFFYPSIICADSDEPWAFAVSYKDQYGNVQIMDGENPIDKVDIPKDEWAKQTFTFVENFIKEEKKKVPQQTFFNTGYYSNNRVQNIGKWDNNLQQFVHEQPKTIDDRFDEEMKIIETKRETLNVKHNKGEITDEMFDEESEKLDSQEESLNMQMFGGIV
tara:strand:+ start:3671 stop:4471 length:801 start_codon:yes stop_codon:yes gene_type:complete